MERSKMLGLWLAAALAVGPGAPDRLLAQQPAGDETPAEAAPFTVRTANGGVVAADHPLSSRIGAKVLSEGGNAADAGVATLLANGVVNPFASGLGGGGFCLYRPAQTGEVHVIDFREQAPAASTADMYVKDGDVDRGLQMRGGLAVATPGEPAGLWALTHRFGTKAWPALVEPAFQLADQGFEVGTLLAKRLRSRTDALAEHAPTFAAAHQRDGEFVAAGDTLRRPALARTLKALRDEGPMPFYHGEIAAAIAARVQAAGGILTAQDLATYSIANRQPVHADYRGYTVYSMPPPSSGGTTLIETLNILEGYDLAELGWTAPGIHRITEAMKHAFADRAEWLGDPDFVDVPVERLTSQDYADELRARIDPTSVGPLDSYGSRMPPPDDAGTTHVSIIDQHGNMLACTSTINTSFGAMVYVDEWGLIMNNEMGDFTAQPGVPNNYGLVGSGQNVVAPKKRPLSSMSPTLVLADGQPFMAVGASGGPTIITGTLLALLNTIDLGRAPAEAIAAPRIHHQWMPQLLFAEDALPGQDTLEQWGHDIKVGRAYNAVQMVLRDADGGLVGVSDPRKHGRPAASDAAAQDPPEAAAE